MIACAFQGNPGGGQTAQGISKGGARRIENREVIEPGGMFRRGRAAQALPGIEANVMMIATGGNESRLRAIALRPGRMGGAGIEPATLGL